MPIVSRRARPTLAARRGLASILVLALAGCGGGETATTPAPPVPRVVSVSVSPSALVVPVGGTGALAAQVTVENGASTAVTWSSSDPSRATVAPSANGATVTGVVPGRVTITARSTVDGTREGSAQVDVIAPPPALSSLAVNPAPVSLGVAQTLTVSPVVQRAAGTESVRYTFASSNVAVATVSDAGVVTGVAAGDATLTVTAVGSGGSVQATTLTAAVPIAVTTGPSYALAVDRTALVLPAGGSALATVSVTNLVSRLQSPIDIALADGPAGVRLDAQGPTSAGAYRITVVADDSVPAGTHLVTVRGRSAPLADRAVRLLLTVTPASPDARFTALAVGGHHTCALNATGQSFCWGLTSRWQVSQSSEGWNLLAPLAVAGAPTFTSLVGSYEHTCGLTAAGQAYCWGRGDRFALGTGNSRDERVPTAVAGSRLFASLTSKGEHTCGLTPAGQALCWGTNSAGQIGDGTIDNFRAPLTPVVGGHVFKLLAAGDQHTCGLKGDGRAWCWGWNDWLQVGNPANRESVVPTPTAVAGGYEYTSLAPGIAHTCGLRTDGQAVCWGNASLGRLGRPSTDFVAVATPVAGGRVFTALASGGTHTCGLLADGQTLCWGENRRGQLGDGTRTLRDVPTLVVDAPPFVAIGAGESHTCGLTREGHAFCWGRNDLGQLGDGTRVERLTPVRARRPTIAAGTH